MTTLQILGNSFKPINDAVLLKTWHKHCGCDCIKLENSLQQADDAVDVGFAMKLAHAVMLAISVAHPEN